jgi:hypothetical protein
MSALPSQADRGAVVVCPYRSIGNTCLDWGIICAPIGGNRFIAGNGESEAAPHRGRLLCFMKNTAGIQSLTGCPFGAQAGNNLIFYKQAAPDGGAYPGRCQGQIATAPSRPTFPLSYSSSENIKVNNLLSTHTFQRKPVHILQ